MAYPVLIRPCNEDIGSVPVKLRVNAVGNSGIDVIGVATNVDEGRTHPPVML